MEMVTQDRDFILAMEAQHMYTHFPQFSPVQGNLYHWRGYVPAGNMKIPMDVILPMDFPNSPPSLIVKSNIQHPNVRANGELKLKILDTWRPDFHVYQALQEAKKLFNRILPKRSMAIARFKAHEQQVARSSTSSTVQATWRGKDPFEEVKIWQEKVNQKKMEIQKLKEELFKKDTGTRGDVLEQIISEIPEPVRLEKTLIALEELIENLKEFFLDGEIGQEDYYRLLKKHVKEWYKTKRLLELTKEGVIHGKSEKTRQKIRS